MDLDGVGGGDRVRSGRGPGGVSDLDDHGPRTGESVYPVLLPGWELYDHLHVTREERMNTAKDLYIELMAQGFTQDQIDEELLCQMMDQEREGIELRAELEAEKLEQSMKGA